MPDNNTVEETVRQIVAKRLRKPNLVFDENTTFKDVGADSLDIVQILVAIESAYGIELDDDELRQIPDTAGFLNYIKEKVAERNIKDS